MNNPLLKPFNGPFGSVPFNEIKDEHFVPAIEQGIKEAESEIKTIIDNKEFPTFKKYYFGIRVGWFKLDSSVRTYFHLFGSESEKELKNLSDLISPMVAEFENNIFLNKDLFKRIEFVYKNKDQIEDFEDIRLVDSTYEDFIRMELHLTVPTKLSLEILIKGFLCCLHSFQKTHPKCNK